MDILKKLLTDKSRPLWEFLNKDARIKITIWDKNYSEVYTRTENDPIEMRLNGLNQDSFLHELCHIYINEVFGGYYWLLKLHLPVGLARFISRICFEHVANCIEHRMFYNLYLDLGGSPTGFISDYNLKKGNNFHLKLRKLDKDSIDPYLGNLLSILADNNPKNHYGVELLTYRKLSPSIFEACILLINNAMTIGVSQETYDFKASLEVTEAIKEGHSNNAYEFWKVVSYNI